MKNLKLAKLGIIVLAQVSLVSAMNYQHVKNKYVEVEKQIQEQSGLYTALSNMVMDYTNLKDQIEHANNSFIEAIDNKNFKQAIEAICMGANPNLKNKNGDTLLIEAVRLGDYKFAKTLIEYGALINEANKDGHTPLIIAILNLPHSLSESDPYFLIEFLIQQGANINQPDFEGNTPLMYAVKSDVKNPVRFLKLFINKETNLNLQNIFGNTALIIRAAKFGDRNSMLTLIELGANVNLTNQSGETAFDCYKKSDKDVTLLLMSESEKKRLEELEKSELDSALQQIFEFEEKERKEHQEKENKKRLKEEDRLRFQRTEEALAQLEAQSGQEENWDEEQQEEVADDWGELEQED